MFKKKSIICRLYALAGHAFPRADRYLGRILWTFLLCLAGCQTISTLPPADLAEPGWTVSQGQAVWRRKADAPEITGELLVAVNPDGRSFVQFTKTPLPFIVAQKTPGSWQLHVVPTNKTYSARGAPPESLVWLQLPECLAGAAPPKKWKWERLENGGFRCQNQYTGELIEGYLNP